MSQFSGNIQYNNTLNMCVTTVEGSVKENSPTQARSILRFLVKPFLSVTVLFFTKQWKQKPEWIPPNS